MDFVCAGGGCEISRFLDWESCQEKWHLVIKVVEGDNFKIAAVGILVVLELGG